MLPQLPLLPPEEMVLKTIKSEVVPDAEYTVIVYAMTDVGNSTSYLYNFSELRTGPYYVHCNTSRSTFMCTRYNMTISCAATELYIYMDLQPIYTRGLERFLVVM